MHSQLDHELPGIIRTMLRRMWKVARFDRETIQDLKSDPTATPQAVAVAALAGLSYGLGFSLFLGTTIDSVLLAAGAGIVAGLLIGFAWLSLTFVIGTRLFRGVTSYWGLARPFFFAWSPGLLFLFMSIPTPPIPDLARGIASAWIIIGSVLAVKHSMGLETQQSLLTFILVFFVFTVVLISYGFISSL